MLNLPVCRGEMRHLVCTRLGERGDISLVVWMARFSTWGSPDVASALRGMYDGIADGHIAREENNEHWRGATSPHAAVRRIIETRRAAA